MAVEGDVRNKDEEFDEMETGQKGLTEEQRFEESEVVPSWGGQLTIRSLVVSAILGVLFSFITLKLSLTTGVIPSLNVAAGLLGYVLIKIWVYMMSCFGFQSQPFTRQENTVIQTSAVAAYGIAFSGGLGTYMVGMTSKIAEQADNPPLPLNIEKLSLGWITLFLLVVSFVGLFSIVALRKTMILDYKLTYPSGTATAKLINSFHTPKGAQRAKKQVSKLFYSAGGSFVWAVIQWLFTKADDCGLTTIPVLGRKALANHMYFDFSSTYFGVGMLCPHYININMFVGGILSCFFLWPAIAAKKGHWFPADLKENNLRSLQGYKVFIAIAMILGDGLFYAVFALAKVIINLVRNRKKTEINPVSGNPDTAENNYDDVRRTQFFLKDQIPLPLALIGYVALSVLSVIVVPHIFHQIRWYQVLVMYLIAPILAFCNSYGCGLTDWSLASSYGKIAIMLIGMWVGISGGVIAGLVACGVMMSIVGTASDLMQDFRTGYLTLASPKSMFFSQLFGTLVGCIVSPLIFWFLFYKPYPDLGITGSVYPAPFALTYRGIALIGIEGFSALPKHCLLMATCFFFGAIVFNAIREILKWGECKRPIMGKQIELHVLIPNFMAMAVPFFVGGYFTISMFLGTCIKAAWEFINKDKAEAYAPAVASGLVCGESLWGVPSAVISIFGKKAPFCLKV